MTIYPQIRVNVLGGGLPVLVGDGSVACYSLRKIVSSYLGAGVRIRRDNDNEEADFSLPVNLDSIASNSTSSGAHDGQSLTTFIGSNNGFVTIWYDQSGNVDDASQTTTTKQPQIVNAGTLETMSGKVSLRFLNDGLVTPGTNTYTQPNSIFSVSQNLTDTGQERIYDAPNANRHVLSTLSTGGAYLLFAGSSATGGVSDTIPNLHTAIFDSTSSFLYKNGSAIISSANAGTASFSPIEIGADGNAVANLWDGYISEIIVFNSNQSSNRTTKEAEINGYYSIY